LDVDASPPAQLQSSALSSARLTVRSITHFWFAVPSAQFLTNRVLGDRRQFTNPNLLLAIRRKMNKKAHWSYVHLLCSRIFGGVLSQHREYELNRFHFVLFLGLAVSFFGCATTSSATGSNEGPATLTFTDPSGDDNGPGPYKYPTDPVYKPGSFDITQVQIEPVDDTVEFRVTVASRIEDPWDSRAWGGNGFSVQMAVIHLDIDHVAGSGVAEGLPGFNVRFKPDEAWDKAVIISPQGPARVNSEIDSKCSQWKSRIIVPRLTRASGRTLTAVVDAAQLGAPVSKSWGVQVLMQSNEGFPDKGDLLTRKVNEFEGQHRFGGGSDYNNDPHVIDMLANPSEAQKEILSKYNKSATEPKPEDLVVIPMVQQK
jgi:hypothetical protein